MGGEDDGSLGAHHSGEAADSADQIFQPFRGRSLHLEKQGMMAGDVMAFQDALDRDHGFLERTQATGRLHNDADKSCDIETEFPGAENG